MQTPNLIDTNIDTILSEVITSYQSFTGKVLQPAQPEYIQCSFLAYHLFLERQRLNTAARNMLIDYSIAPMLDLIVALIGVQRIPPKPAKCTLIFTLVEGHATITLPAGTRVASIDGLAIFEVDEDRLIDNFTNRVELSATCQTEGIIGNGYSIGKINTILDPQAYISSVVNKETTYEGSDAESDEELRIRAKQASNIYSVAGSRDAYIYFTKTVSTLISDVKIFTTSDDNLIPSGEVDIYVLLKNGQLPSLDLRNEIELTLSDEKVRPMNDIVSVKSPTKITYQLFATIIKNQNYKGLDTDLQNEALAILSDYTKNKMQYLGLDIVSSEIKSKLRIENKVYDIELIINPPIGKTLTGNNLVINDNEFAYCQYYSVNIV